MWSFICEIFKKLWSCINSISSEMKTLIIVLLSLLLILYYNKETTSELIEQIKTEQTLPNEDVESYTFEMSEQINNYVDIITTADHNSFSVLLLNYHNTIKSVQGLPYIYLNCIVEKTKDYKKVGVSEYWRELQYIDYFDELNVVHSEGQLYISNLDSAIVNFPKLVKKLQICGAKAAHFYPIEGLNNPIGMVVILYDHNVQHDLNFYLKFIDPSIQKLSTILDSPNIEKYQNK